MTVSAFAARIKKINRSFSVREKAGRTGKYLEVLLSGRHFTEISLSRNLGPGEVKEMQRLHRQVKNRGQMDVLKKIRAEEARKKAYAESQSREYALDIGRYAERQFKGNVTEYCFLGSK